MTGREQILRLAEIYGAALQVERTTVSWRLFQDTNKLDAIVGGRDLLSGRLERAIRFLDENWPAQADWPIEIARPSLKVGVAPVAAEPARATG